MSTFKICRTASRGFFGIAMAALLALHSAAQVQSPVQLPTPPVKALPKVPAPKPPAIPAKPPAAEAPRTSTTPAPNRPATTPNNPATTPNRPAVPAAPPRTPKPPIVERRPIIRPHADHTKLGDVTRSPGGKPIAIQARGGMNIHFGPGQARTTVRERADHSVVVSNQKGNGYIQRPYLYRNATIMQRTYYVNGAVSRRIYQPYVLGGVRTSVYAPSYYYPVPFYGWAYYPWGAPVPYGWGWAGDPWYGYYGDYFAPYPVYAGPSPWLTDYLLAQSLQAAYQEPVADPGNSQASYTPITPDVKQQIADEVRRQIMLENAEASAAAQAPPDPGSSGVDRMLSDNTAHVFVVSASLNVQSSAGECWITEGDVLRLSPGPRPDQSTANLVVLASKGQNPCRKGSTVTVGVADLQDMQNHMRETIGEGLADLQKQQGQNGIPAAPPIGGRTAPLQTAYAAMAPPPDPNVATELNAQTREAGQAEQEVLAQASLDAQNAGPNPEPVAPLDFRGSCDAATVLDRMRNPPTPGWKNSLSAPLLRIESQGLEVYIRDQGGISSVRAQTQADLATLLRTNGPRDDYGIQLNQAWINLLDCMSRR